MGENAEGKWYSFPLDGPRTTVVEPLQISRREIAHAPIPLYRPTFLQRLRDLLPERLPFTKERPMEPIPANFDWPPPTPYTPDETEINQYFQELLDRQKNNVTITAAERTIERSEKPHLGPHSDRVTDTFQLALNGVPATLTHIKGINYRVDGVYHHSNYDSEDHAYTLALNNSPPTVAYTYTIRDRFGFRHDQKAVIESPTLSQKRETDHHIVLFEAFKFFRALVMSYEQDWGDNLHPDDDRVTGEIRKTGGPSSHYDPSRPAN
jgi:hypothetical protein